MATVKHVKESQWNGPHIVHVNNHAYEDFKNPIDTSKFTGIGLIEYHSLIKMTKFALDAIAFVLLLGLLAGFSPSR